MRVDDVETEAENKNKWYKWYMPMYTVLLGGFLLYVVPLARNQKPHNGSTSGTNVVQYVEADDDDDYETEDVEDSPTLNNKKGIGLSDLDLSSVKKYPSDEDWGNMLTNGTREINDKIEDILNVIAFDEKWSEMSRACDILNSIPGWHTNVSEEVQLSFLSALRDFNHVSIPDIIPFLGSEYEDVTELAESEIKDYIDDSENENEIATLIVKLSPVVNDEDFSDALVLKIESMDTEIAALAMIGVMRNGTETIKKSLSESMEFITDQTEMTEEAVLKWAIGKKSDNEDDD